MKLPQINDDALKILIEDFHAENLVGKFSNEDSEFVKEIIRDFVKNYLLDTPEVFKKQQND